MAESGPDLSKLVGFSEGTREPGTPVTAGAAVGAGPGQEALHLSQQPDEDMEKLIAYLPAFEKMANAPGAPRASRNLVRAIKAKVSPGG